MSEKETKSYMEDKVFLVMWGITLILCAVIIALLSYGNVLIGQNHALLMHLHFNHTSGSVEIPYPSDNIPSKK